MTSESKPTPDPSWDYYQTWHKCHEAIAKLEEGIKIMGNQEQATKSADDVIHEVLVESWKLLIDGSVSLPTGEFLSKSPEDSEVVIFSLLPKLKGYQLARVLSSIADRIQHDKL